MAGYMLSTTDNPYNPYTEWDQWLAWDQAAGYYTCDYLARIVRSSDDLSEADDHQAIADAIDEIVEYNVNGVYTKVFASD